MDFRNLKNEDIDIYNLIEREKNRQEYNLELIASENFVSDAVMEATGSYLTNKYAEGLPGRRYYGGCEFVDEVENIAIERAKKLFNADHANVQSHSGSNANFTVYKAFLNYKDNVLGMNLQEGGHLTHGSNVNFSGQLYNFFSYGVDPKSEMIDYGRVLEIAKIVRPKMIVAGASAYPRSIDFKKFREIADEVGAILFVDMSHIAGLVAAGLHQNPVDYADVVTTTTHKTLRGPRGAIILCKEKHKKLIDKAVFPGTQGGPLEHVIAAKAVAFKEALSDEFKEYQRQVVKNAKAMADRLNEKEKLRVISNSTDNHLILLDVTGLSITGRDAEDILGDVNITVNKNTIPGDKLKPTITSGIRLGSPAITTRGFKEEEAIKLADLIYMALSDNTSYDYVKKEVKDLCERFPLYK